MDWTLLGRRRIVSHISGPFRIKIGHIYQRVFEKFGDGIIILSLLDIVSSQIRYIGIEFAWWPQITNENFEILMLYVFYLINYKEILTLQINTRKLRFYDILKMRGKFVS